MTFHLLDLLEKAARDAPSNGITFYGKLGQNGPVKTTYSELLKKVKSNAATLLAQNIACQGKVVLIHLDNHYDYIEWYWSVLATGAIPAISTPLATDPVAAERHLNHLQTVLEQPKVLTADRLLKELSLVPSLNTITLETIAREKAKQEEEHPENTTSSVEFASSSNIPAALMLTSGSTGNAKAVVLEHSQLLAAVQGKSKALKTTSESIFFNWIGFDHVACLVEIHLHALLNASNQIHVPATDLLRDPKRFFELIEQEKVSVAFTPNFFVASVVRTFDYVKDETKIDLSSLKHVVSGGEANVVKTSIEFSQLVHKFNGPADVLRTAFGMTETGGASHYHLSCPSYEISRELPFCAVGLTNEPVRQRITSETGAVLSSGENGNLELSGTAVFKKYYNNPTATADSFTADGWFKTGDKGSIDSDGILTLGGRSKDSLIINGVKYFSHELETALEEAKIPGVTPSYLAVFSVFPEKSDSEEIVVVFLPSEFMLESDENFVSTISKIAQTSMLYCSKKPVDSIPLPLEYLPKSALGKLARPKLKISYENGIFDEHRAETKARVSSFAKARRVPPVTETEIKIAEVFSEEFGIDKDEVGIEDSLVDMGIDSIQLIRFKNLVEEKLGLDLQIPMISVLRNPSIKGLSNELEKLSEGVGVYEPVVELQTAPATGARLPIFFIHPGLGEILIFLNLAKFFTDRTVYAIRAPGFNPGEEMFTSLDHMTDTYVAAIRRKQPEGPYILCGYSFGGMIGFEIAKKLEALDLEVGFVASFNLPPNIKFRMQELDWTETILTLVYFLGFIAEETAIRESAALHKLTEPEVLDWVMERAPAERLRELDLNAEKLRYWSSLSVSLHGLAHDYEPTGKVSKLDVFYAVPLMTVGDSKNLWLEDHLKKWDGFVDSSVQYHDCTGNHYTMMDGDNVLGLQKKLKEAMAKRGVL